MRRSPGRAAALVLAASLTAGSAAAAAPACGPETVLTLVGLDTTTDTALLALPGAGGATSHLVSWTLGADRARAHPVAPADRGLFGGSIGGGPIFRFARCGADCLQPMRLRAGAWEPLGEALVAPAAATVHATYDRAGSPWLVLHSPADEPGRVLGRAYELVAGEWRSRGVLEIAGVTAPGAAPAPWFASGVVSGAALFAAAGEPRLWLAGLPAGAEPGGAQLFAFHRQAAALVTADGGVYRTPDAGRSWQRSTWTPWRTGTAEPWVRGRDYTVDVPVGPAEGELPLVWFDRRLREAPERLLLTAMGAGGGWRELAAVPGELPTTLDEPLPVTHVFRSARGDWTVLYGCVTSEGRAVLVARDAASGDGGTTRLVPIDEPSRRR